MFSGCVVLCTVLGVIQVATSEAPLVLEGKVAISVDSRENVFSLRTGVDGAEFLTRGAPASKMSRADRTVVSITPFGELNAVRMFLENGDLTVAAVHPELPFAFFQVQHTNASAQPESVAGLTPFHAPLSLSMPAAGLKVLGTAGLTATDANPGSYTFLAVANPKTRAGVVAAWLTHERGSGLVF